MIRKPWRNSSPKLHLCNWLYGSYLVKIAKYFYRKAYRLGGDKGLKQGILIGRSNFQLEIDHEKQDSIDRVNEQRRISESWVTSQRSIEFTDGDINAILSDFKSKGIDPSAEQRQMIFSNAPATYVLAGAGSGKSTTLILRIIALHIYKNISFNDLCVFTFTRNSRQDFIDKLREKLLLWDKGISEKEARGIVLTFHSMVYSMARSALSSNYSRPKIFELLDKKEEVDPNDIENFMSVEDATDKGEEITLRRDDYLRRAYEKTYNIPEYQKLIRHLYVISLAGNVNSYTEGHNKPWLNKDEEETDNIFNIWKLHYGKNANDWFPAFINPTLDPIAISEVDNKQFYANGYINELNAYIILGLDENIFTSETTKLTKDQLKKLRMKIGAKMRLIINESDKPTICVKNLKDLVLLKEKMNVRISLPVFKIAAPGGQPGKILDVVFGIISFMQNLSIDVETELAAIKPAEQYLSFKDNLLAQVTREFYRQLKRLLDEDGIYLFNDLFSHFSDPINIQSLNDASLRKMQHLMIDEFQDISPQIVHWITNCKRELAKREKSGFTSVQCGTLMVIGDDWQSIYGWRGSSPLFFTEFESRFPAPEFARVILRNNYRSSQVIVDVAYSTLSPSQQSLFPEKKPFAVGKHAASTVPVQLVSTSHTRDRPDDKETSTPSSEVNQLIKNIELDLVDDSVTKPIYLVFRSTKDRNYVTRILKAELPHACIKRNQEEFYPVETFSIHTSKGLESDHVYMIGDIKRYSDNPLYNKFYKAAGLGISYDSAQDAEMHRLAYVGITRARKKCVWIADAQVSGHFSRLKNSEGIKDKLSHQFL